ncbi:MAG: type II CAAX endopeptidase family protein [candidate division WOR-3 bacterium]
MRYEPANPEYIPWKFKDVVFVLLIISIVDLIFFLLRYYDITSNGYLHTMIGIAVPILWARKYYDASLLTISLNRSAGIIKPIFVGIFAGLCLTYLNFWIIGAPIPLSILKGLSFNTIGISILSLISAEGFRRMIFGPLEEEIIFRAFVFRGLQKYTGLTWAMVISSVIFCFVHERLFAYRPLAIFMILFMYSCAYCLLLNRYKTLIAPLACHMFSNYLVNLIKLLLPYSLL